MRGRDAIPRAVPYPFCLSLSLSPAHRLYRLSQNCQKGMNRMPNVAQHAPRDSSLV